MIAAENLHMLRQALSDLAQVIQWRMAKSFPDSDVEASLMPEPLGDWLMAQVPLAEFVRQHQLNRVEHLALLMALAPHLDPDFFDRTITAQLPQAGDYPQIGGWRGKSHRGFLPTGETGLFILGGNQFANRLRLRYLFSEDHIFAKEHVLYLDLPEEGEPSMSGKLVMQPDYIDLFTFGHFSRPRFSMHFPAERISTEMEWQDLVLNTQTSEQVQDLQTWIAHSPTILNEWGMKKKLKPGYRVLFHGPPGTGKTLTATLLGKYTNRDVYKIDLSMVVSKFIGETEKNLANLFARAEKKDWILFFDEADALFSKRTNVRDAHDRYANQEVSYLLQRVENYDGLVILATNSKNNIDEAFLRRFQSIINFPKPDPGERLKLWEQTFPHQVKLEKSIELSTVANKYDLTGADIINIVQHCCLQALDSGDSVIYEKALLKAIKREFNKAGKLV
jgi:hypothetical protein